MLIQFSLKNFGSFRDEQTFSFMAASYKEMPEWLISRDVPGLKGESYLSAAGVFGANGSGKSMLLDAIATLRRLVRTSAQMMPDESLPYDPFKLSAETVSADTSFEIVFLHGNIRYDYALRYRAEEVAYEELRRFEKRTPQLLFRVERVGGEMTLTVTGRMTKLRKQEEYLRSKPRSLLLSRGAQEGIPELVEPYSWISGGLLIYEAPFDHTDQSIYGPIIEGQLGDELKEQLVSLARRADLGILDIQARDLPELPEESLQHVYAPEMVKRLVEMKRKTAVFVHQGESTPVEFSTSDESVGTRSFLSAAAAALTALKDGKTLCFDEIDCSLHPKLVEALVRLFSDKEWNPHGAQLLFTSHTASIMDYLRRDQVWKTSKSMDGSTTLDSLADYCVRVDERKSRGYAAGRYGGVPFVDFHKGGDDLGAH